MIFVTGITGKSGTWFLRALIREGGIPGQTLRCLVRPGSDTALLDSCGLSIEKVVGDLDDLEFLTSAMRTDSAKQPLPGARLGDAQPEPPSTGINPPEPQQTDDQLTVLHIAGIGKSINVAKAAVKNDAKRLIFVHTTGIYSKYKKASQDYLQTEATIDTIIKGRNIDINILRPTMIYGSIDDGNVVVFIKMAHKLKLFPVINHGSNLLQPVHARDLGEAYYNILINEEKTRNKNYNLSGKAPLQMIEMFKIISQKLGRKTTFISIPFIIAYTGAWLVYLVSLTKSDYRERVQRMVEDRTFSHEDAKNDFGYDPVTFEIGISDEIDEFLSKMT